MNITKSTARAVIYRYKKYGHATVGKHGGHKKHLISPEVGKIILDFVDDNPTCFLREIRSFLVQSENVTISRSTISRYLEGQLLTFKKAKTCVENRNSDRVKQSRYEYALRFIEEGWRTHECVFIDEVGFNLWTQRLNARSKKGVPANVIVPTNRGRNISMIMAIWKFGPINFRVVPGSVNHDVYQDFIEELSSKLPDGNYRLIHDNASIHFDTISIYRVYNLPPYSPFLNPIETVFAKLKGNIRSQISMNRELLNLTHAERMRTLETTIKEEVQKDDYKDLSNYFRHCRKFLAKCLLKHDIFGD